MLLGLLKRLFAPRVKRCTALECCCEPDVVDSNCCPDPIPATLTVSISAPGCATLDGVTFQINHDPSPRWIGSTSNNGHTIQVSQGDTTLGGDPYCPIALTCDGFGVVDCLALPGTMSCSPFLHVASCTTTDPCGCTGTFTITITITE